MAGAKADGSKRLFEQLGLQILGHRAGFSKGEVAHRAHEIRLVFQKGQRGFKNLAHTLALPSRINVALGPAHFPGHHAAADVVLPAVAQRSAPEFFVDVLNADAFVVHAPKGAGLFTLHVMPVHHAGYGQNNAPLSECLLFLGWTEQGGLGDQPNQVVFKGLDVYGHKVKHAVDFALAGFALELGIQQVEHLVVAKVIATEVFV